MLLQFVNARHHEGQLADCLALLQVGLELTLAVGDQWFEVWTNFREVFDVQLTEIYTCLLELFLENWNSGYLCYFFKF